MHLLTTIIQAEWGLIKSTRRRREAGLALYLQHYFFISLYFQKRNRHKRREDQRSTPSSAPRLIRKLTAELRWLSSQPRRFPQSLKQQTQTWRFLLNHPWVAWREKLNSLVKDSWTHLLLLWVHIPWRVRRNSVRTWSLDAKQCQRQERPRKKRRAKSKIQELLFK